MTLGLGLRRNRQPPPHTECFPRNLQSGRSLLPLVFRAIDHAHHLSHKAQIKPPLSRYLLGSFAVLNIVLQNRVQHIIRRETVCVLLVGPQLGGGWLIERGLRNYWS